ncbi:MAG: glycosyltransferase family 2 protein [Mycobacteriales bacterium]
MAGCEDRTAHRDRAAARSALAPLPAASLVLATLGRPQRLAATLAALRQLDPGPTEVIVVDGDPLRSAEASCQTACVGAPWPLRYLTSRPGLTRQRNLGLAHASGAVVVFLDDDAVPEPGALGALLAAYDDPEVVGTTGRVVQVDSHRLGGQRSLLRRVLHFSGPEGRFTCYGYPRRIVHPQRPRDVEFLSGCFMSARRQLAQEVGFDEALAGYALAEDEDFGFRLSRHGRLRYVPEAVVHHDNSGFAGRDRRSFDRMLVINRYYLFAKNFPQTPRSRAGFAALLVALLVQRTLNGNVSGVLGLLDGVRALAHGAQPAAQVSAGGG